MKALIFADPHLGIHKSSEIWHEASIKLAKEIVDVCVKKDIENVICLGDWFDNRKFVNIKTMDIASQIAEILKDLKLYIIVGNHDTFFKDQINPTSLSFYEKHKNIVIISSPHRLENLILVPWNTHGFLLNKDLPMNEYKDSIILGHFEINGFALNEGYVYHSSPLNPEDFEKFRLVLTGHFHTPSRKGNIIYLGAPFQLSFNDSGGKRGYYILDDNKLSFLEFTGAPKFIKITTGEKPTKELIEKNIVKLIYLKDYGTVENNRKMEIIQRMQPLLLSTDFSKASEIIKKDNEERTDTEIKDNREVFFDFIDSVQLPSHLKISVLRDVVDILLKEPNV